MSTFDVAKFVARHPRLKVVRGFLLFDYRPQCERMLVLAHSVVGTPDGTLNDVSPRDNIGPEAFLRHVGTVDEFELIAAVAPSSIRVSYAVLEQLLGY